MKINTILCPTDGSDASRAATKYAATLARWYGAAVTPLQVRAPALAAVLATPQSDNDESALPAGAEIVYGESPADAIVGFAAASKVDLIVMGTRGLWGVHHMIHGSVTETVLRQVDCPVLTIPPRAESTAELPFRRILCAVDFSAASLEALRLAVSFAEDSDAILEVFHVIDEPAENALFVPRTYDVHHHREMLERHVLECLDRVLLPISRDRVHARLKTGYGQADQEILRAAEDVDMIVLGVGVSGDVSFGSTVNTIVRYARCPVLTVRQ